VIKTETEVDFVMRQLDAMVARGLEKLSRNKGPEPLKELHLELTHRCNLRCVMCHHWEMPFDDPASVKREMDLAAIKKFVNESRLLDGVEIVVLTGGEPWLRADIDEILAFLSGRLPKARIGVLTNFWNTEMVRRRLTAAKARGVQNLWLGSSLDGLEQAHDEVRGQRGAFRGLMETAAMVRSDFPEIDFSFSFTITPRNYRQLWAAYQHVKSMGLWFGAQMVVNHQGGFDAPETAVWNKVQLARVAEQIDAILLDICRGEGAVKKLLDGKQRESRWLWSRLLYWRYLRKYGEKPERFFKDCLAGQRYAMFDPEGNLFFCPVNKHRAIGNVNENGFDTLWTSPKARSERGFVESCKCDCWLNCIANPILDRALEAGA
jgi:MoaA/NifB/PqqE/SkfB family radical SAM enzyme